MTEKRFIGSSGGVYDQYKGDRFTWAEWEEVLRIMNNLDEKARERSKALSKLQKENEQLKMGINSLKLVAQNWEALDEEKDEQLDRQNQALKKLIKENEQLKKQLQKIQDSFEVNWTQNYIEFDKDKLYIKDNNTEIRLNDGNLFIEVYIPQIGEYYRFRYIVTGRSSKMREFIKNYEIS